MDGIFKRLLNDILSLIEPDFFIQKFQSLALPQSKLPLVITFAVVDFF